MREWASAPEGDGLVWDSLRLRAAPSWSGRVLQQEAPTQGALSDNHVQFVGEAESTVKPHMDSQVLCDFAGVTYPHPQPGEARGHFLLPPAPAPAPAGRWPGRQHLPSRLRQPHPGLRRDEAAGERVGQDVEVENVFNRLTVYRADFVHLASAYFGKGDKRNKRATTLFFWRAVR